MGMMMVMIAVLVVVLAGIRDTLTWANQRKHNEGIVCKGVGRVWDSGQGCLSPLELGKGPLQVGSGK